MDSSIYGKLDLVGLVVHLLFKANYTDKKTIFNGKEIVIKRGQFITGRKILGEEVGLSPSTIWDKLKILKNINFIDIKSNNKYSIITIINYNQYQNNNNNPTANPTTSRQPADNQPTHLKNNKKDKNINTRPLLIYFKEKYEELKQKPYIINWGKDGSIIKSILNAGINEQDIKDAVIKFLTLKDDFVVNNGFTIPIFKSQIQKLLLKPKSEIKERPKL